jgi:serine/threonine protein kinase
MSPEQLQGKEADARSDIFAFGLTLYEMLTGHRAFEASSQASLIGAILHTEPPPVSSLVPVAPPALGRVVRQYLAKDPDNRWQSARDIAFGQNRPAVHANPCTCIRHQPTSEMEWRAQWSAWPIFTGELRPHISVSQLLALRSNAQTKPRISSFNLSCGFVRQERRLVLQELATLIDDSRMWRKRFGAGPYDDVEIY